MASARASSPMFPVLIIDSLLRSSHPRCSRFDRQARLQSCQDRYPPPRAHLPLFPLRSRSALMPSDIRQRGSAVTEQFPHVPPFSLRGGGVPPLPCYGSPD